MSSTSRAGHSARPPHRYVLPLATTAGRRALKLLGAAVAAWVVMVGAVALGVRGDSAWPLQVLFLAVPNGVGLLCVLGGLVYAVLALFRGERSLLLVAPLLIGAVAVMFVIGEFAVPH